MTGTMVSSIPPHIDATKKNVSSICPPIDKAFFVSDETFFVSDETIFECFIDIVRIDDRIKNGFVDTLRYRRTFFDRFIDMCAYRERKRKPGAAVVASWRHAPE